MHEGKARAPSRAAGGTVKLLIAMDTSEHSKAALAEVRRLAWPSGTKVTLLSVVRTDLYAFADFYAPAITQIESLVAEDAKRARSYLEEQARTLAPLAVDVRVEHGDARLMICDVARELGVDWVIVGSHGRRGFQKLVLGSVASHVVTHAPCSVLVVKKSAAA
jgi:nucleotide-binding universal stress UspA family protein